MRAPPRRHEAHRILLVDPSSPEDSLLYKRLPENGFSLEIEPVAEIDTALTELREKRVDLVLLDFSQAAQSRLKEFLQLRRNFPHVPVVVLTGVHNQELGLEAVEHGAVDYFVKGEADEKFLSHMIVYAIDRKKTHDKLFYRYQFEELITDISTRFINLRAHEINRALKESLEKIGEFAQVDRSYIFLFRNDLAVMDRTHEWCREGIDSWVPQLKGMSTRGCPWLMEKLRKLEPVHIPRVADLPPHADNESKAFEKQKIRSLVSIPMVCRSQLVGFVGFDTVREEKFWSRDIISFLKIISDIFVNAIERTKADKSLRRSQRKYRDLVETSNDLIWSVDAEGRWTFLNRAVRKIYGYEPKEMLGHLFTEYEMPEQAQLDLEMFARIRSGEPCFQYETTHLKKDGTPVHLSFNAITLRDHRGNVLGTTGTATDVTERKKAIQNLMRSEARFKSLVANMPGVVYRYECFDKICSLEFMSEAIEEISGYATEDLIREKSRAFTSILYEEDVDLLRSAHRKAIEEGTSFAIEYRVRHRNGSLRWVRDLGRVIHDEGGRAQWIDGAIFDITERTVTAARLKDMAYYDPVTRLPNRALLTDRISQAITRARRNHTLLAIMCIDLDEFKQVNDTMGHTAGDQLLKAIAERLQSALYEIDTVTRIGGDEFAVLLPFIEKADDAVVVGEKILNEFKTPFKVSSYELFATCCIGVSLYPNDGEDAETLIKNADTAMNRAKDKGRNNYQLYSSAMNVLAFERLYLENGLRYALDRDEFTIHYQPQIDAITGRIIGVEALLRWMHPTLGLVPPLDFISLAEETGLILPIGEWVMRRACEQTRVWQKAGFGTLRVAVNLSSRQLQYSSIASSVGKVLKDTGLDPSYLELELTESAITQNLDQLILGLREINRMGVKLTIDDFGTGFSSLVTLRRFPVNVLKIDRSFIRDIGSDLDNAAITKAIISLAHNLKLEVVAEGVETQTQIDFLRANDCDTFQGFYYSKPIPPEELYQLLEKRASF